MTIAVYLGRKATKQTKQKKQVFLILVAYVIGTHLWGNSNVHLQHMSIQLMSVFHHKTGCSQTSQLIFMLQCNEHVEMDKF